MTERQRPKKEQIEEWFDSEVTEYFFGLVAELSLGARDLLADQGFDTLSAEQLMAQRGNLWGLREAFETVEQVFISKSFAEIEESEDGEHVGDSSPGRSGTH